MTTSLDPLVASRRIGDSYRRYLSSTFSPRRADLAKEFTDQLNNSFRLTRGPILEASAPFEPGKSVAQLMDADVLSQGWTALADQFPLERPLHLHQQQAVERAVSDGRNLVVSTGTGSGKTESFLIPIVDHLLREREAGTLDDPGVRALLLYPMNALANDQTKRLRRLLAGLPDITFGRYVGETSETQNRAEDDFERRYPGEPRLRNELISREAMRDRPPHILLTNFAMLEYLLLRPDDTALFDGPTAQHWRFLVLDEAHVYGGAQGTEVAMLLRRVRDRILKSERGRLQCFATSATLGRGVEDHPKLVEFAENLFGERFTWDVGNETGDVVVATRRGLVQGSAANEIPQARFAELRARARAGATSNELADCLTGLEIPSPGDEEPAEEYLWRILRDESHVIQIQALLQKGSVDLSVAASQLFTGPTAEADTVALVDLCVMARPGHDDTPLLPARYHFFVRALEGAFVCQHPAHRADRSRMSLTRHEQCRSCRLDQRAAAMFEFGVCRHCRAEYLVGRLDPVTKKFLQPLSLATATDYLLLGAAVDAEDEDNAALEKSESADKAQPAYLCPGCAKVSDGQDFSCECTDAPPVRVSVVERKKDDVVLRRCAACTGRAPGEVVFRFQTGTDAPVAVIATDLYQAIPSAAGHEELVGGGRKLLTFSDSRQDAAFFAPYLERTYRRSIQRRLIATAISELSSDEVPRAGDVLERVRKLAVKALVLDPDASGHTHRSEVGEWIVEELLAFDRRQSLEGTGLAEISVAVPRQWKPPRQMTALGFTDQETVDLFQLLLETVRAGGAVSVPDGVDIRSERFAPRNMELGLRQTGAEYAVISWLPGSALNRRLEIVQKALSRKGIDADAGDVLKGIWTHLSDPNGPWAKTLTSFSMGSSGSVFRLDWERFEFRPVADDHRPFRCSTCRRLWWRTVAGLCPGWRCAGDVSELDDIEQVREGHYASLYEKLSPIGMEVQEHTAQWTASEASRIQDRFVAGDVNVLSCSTTFELGVDVGEIQAVLLRNVPPSAANYVQRAGRAGRRTDSAALVVTYAQRRSHDLTFFDNPHRMVDGFVAPPVIVLENPSIVRRHAHAIAYAEFERMWVDSGRSQHRSVEDVFMPNDEGSIGSEEFMLWLRTHPSTLQDALRRVLPDSQHSTLGVDDWSWTDALVEATEEEPTFGWLRRAQDEVTEELASLDEMAAEAYDAKVGWRGDSLKRVRQALAGRQAIGFLASRNIIPKYGFPVDVVGLNVAGSGSRDAANVDLTRDLGLAISEYSPGSSVVAAKNLWKSTGLAVRQGQQWPTYQWAICDDCGAFRYSLDELAPCNLCGSSSRRAGQAGSFALPLFGFVGEAAEKPGETRPLRLSLTETYFGHYRDAEPDFGEHAGSNGQQVQFRASRQGQIVVVNRGPAGRGFRICEWCGHGAPAPSHNQKVKEPADHKDIRRPGRRCKGTLRTRHLGHHYFTDVLELRFPEKINGNEARSLLYAILEGVEAVDVARDDVGGTLYHHSADAAPALVLYDAVAGGAGHVFRIADNLDAVLRAGLAKVSSCECGPETSCYSCLRNYRNQSYHDNLRRSDAIAVLTKYVGPEDPSDDYEFVDDAARPFLEASINAGVGAPTVGYEVGDSGYSAELAWEGDRVAVTIGDDPARDSWLAENGWTLFPAETSRVDDLTQTLGSTNGIDQT